MGNSSSSEIGGRALRETKTPNLLQPGTRMHFNHRMHFNQSCIPMQTLGLCRQPHHPLRSYRTDSTSLICMRPTILKARSAYQFNHKGLGPGRTHPMAHHYLPGSPNGSGCELSTGRAHAPAPYLNDLI